MLDICILTKKQLSNEKKRRQFPHKYTMTLRKLAFLNTPDKLVVRRGAMKTARRVAKKFRKKEKTIKVTAYLKDCKDRVEAVWGQSQMLTTQT